MNFYHESCLYMDSNLKAVLSSVSGDMDVSVCRIVKVLLSLVCDMYSYTMVSESLTQYQNHHPKDGFVQYRYRLTDEEHKKFTIARQKMEISISKLLLLGFLIFFDKIIIQKKESEITEKVLYSYTKFFEKYYYIVFEFENRIQRE